MTELYGTTFTHTINKDTLLAGPESAEPGNIDAIRLTVFLHYVNKPIQIY